LSESIEFTIKETEMTRFCTAVIAAALVTGPAMAQQAPPQFPNMTFFITSTGGPDGANFGGIEGADRHCQTLAAKDVFTKGDHVDVVGTSKGRGFAGGVKRYGFHGGPKTHGQSDRHRGPGSIGAGTTPGRVRKGLHMAGHMGDARVTVKNLRVFESDAARGVLLIEGAVPGADGGLVQIAKRAKKA